MKKACTLSNGCPESLIDTARIRLYLEENGWQIVDEPTAADLIIFNACALTNEIANGSLSTIQKLQEKAKDGSQVIVWGCLTKIDPEALRQIYQGPTFGEKELYKLDEIINVVTPIERISTNQICSPYNVVISRGKIYKVGWRKIYRVTLTLFFWYYLSHLNKKIGLFKPEDPSIFYIKVSTGCLGHCTYCAIRLSRGEVNSKPIDKIMDEFREGLSKGYRTFALLGTDLGSYGRDLGYTLVDLLKEMVKEKGAYRIGLRNVNPYFLNQMLDDLEPVFSTGKIWYTEIPVESGSNRILRLMGRLYTVETLKETIRRLRRVCPDIKIRSQFMVGFPTETKKDFSESMRLIDELKFDYLEVYKFSPRPGTAAEKIDGRVPDRIRNYRKYRMLSKAERNGILKVVRKN